MAEDKSGLFLVAIVAIVAVFGIIMMSGFVANENTVGEAFRTSLKTAAPKQETAQPSKYLTAWWQKPTSNPPEETDPFNFDGRLVWFNPAVHSADFHDLFYQGENWAIAREDVDIFQFARSVLANQVSDEELSNAVTKLNEWEITIALGGEAVKHWDCTGVNAANAARVQIERIRAAGGNVVYYTMDEPLYSGLSDTACNFDATEGSTEAGMIKTAQVVKTVVDMLWAWYPDIKIGVVEVWPGPGYAYGPEVHKQWFDLLYAATGGRLDHYHIDHGFVNIQNPDYNELIDMQSYITSKGVRFGVIYNYLLATNDYEFYQGTKSYMNLLKPLLGTTHDAFFASWEPVPMYNLPDSSGYSFTNLIKDAAAGEFVD
ncbi:MAG: hypothetical protein V1659_04975 [Candidatus Woesearchaeota archaeon]